MFLLICSDCIEINIYKQLLLVVVVLGLEGEKRKRVNVLERKFLRTLCSVRQVDCARNENARGKCGSNLQNGLAIH